MKTKSSNIDYRCIASFCLLGCSKNSIWNQRPKLFQIQRRLELPILQKMKTSHSNLSEVTWVILIEKYSVMMLTTGIATTTRMRSVLSDATMACTYISPLFPVF